MGEHGGRRIRNNSRSLAEGGGLGKNGGGGNMNVCTNLNQFLYLVGIRIGGNELGNVQ